MLETPSTKSRKPLNRYQLNGTYISVRRERKNTQGSQKFPKFVENSRIYSKVWNILEIFELSRTFKELSAIKSFENICILHA